jgi:thiol-disulfide isomerase/thioredoxin
MRLVIFLSFSMSCLASNPLIADDPPTLTPERLYRTILDDYAAARRAFAVKEAATPEGQIESLRGQYPLPEDYYGRLLELAESHPKDPVAVDSLAWIVATSTNGYDAFKERGPRIKRAMEILANDHLDDPRVGRVCLELVAGAAPLRDEFLQTIESRSTDRQVKGRACLALGEFLLMKSETVASLQELPDDDWMKKIQAKAPHRLPYYETLRLADARALALEGESLLERALTEYGDLAYDPIFQPQPTKTLAEVASTDLLRLHKLAIGQEAPEIDGRDVNDRRFKLSDYRGKVVVLVFWGSWCGPCMAKVPQERELVERLKGRPFALLGVDSESDRQAGIKAMERERMTWPNWSDGHVGEGPIARLYQIQGYPTVFVLDAKGIIRAKNVGGEPMDKVIDGLLKEVESQ